MEITIVNKAKSMGKLKNFLEKIAGLLLSPKEVINWLFKDPLSGLFYFFGSLFWLFAIIFLKNYAVFNLKTVLIICVLSAILFYLSWKRKKLSMLLIIILYLGILAILVNEIFGIFTLRVGGQALVLTFTLGAILFYVGETRRIRLEDGKANRLSYLPGLILYFKEDKTLWLKNIGRGTALNPSIKIEETERTIPYKMFQPGEEKPISIDILGISTLENLKSLNIKINFNCPYETYESSHYTKQEIKGISGEIELKKVSWHADYKR